MAATKIMFSPKFLIQLVKVVLAFLVLVETDILTFDEQLDTNSPCSDN